jgi:dUTP pyrophosphatase
VIVELLHSDAEPPKRATRESAGYDLFAYLKGRTIRCAGARTADLEPREEDEKLVIYLPPQVRAVIPLGFKARLPEGIEAQIRPRSGTSFKKGLRLSNAPGTIDSDYPDEWMVLVDNPTPTRIRIEHGERIAQMVLARYEVLPIEFGKVGITTDRVGGLGSTG